MARPGAQQFSLPHCLPVNTFFPFAADVRVVFTDDMRFADRRECWRVEEAAEGPDGHGADEGRRVGQEALGFGHQRRVAGIFDSMTAFLGFIALVTLSLGGIGVMNIMLVTVSERTREIGLRKALGATRLRIMIDFLAEGCVLAFASGFIGWSIAFGLSSLLKLVQMPDMFPGLPVSGETTALSFGTLAIIAIASALFPAWRAASLTPVEALRYER